MCAPVPRTHGALVARVCHVSHRMTCGEKTARHAVRASGAYEPHNVAISAYLSHVLRHHTTHFYEPMTCHRRRCEKRRRDEKRPTSSSIISMHRSRDMYNPRHQSMMSFARRSRYGRGPRGRSPAGFRGTPGLWRGPARRVARHATRASSRPHRCGSRSRQSRPRALSTGTPPQRRVRPGGAGA